MNSFHLACCTLWHLLVSLFTVHHTKEWWWPMTRATFWKWLNKSWPAVIKEWTEQGAMAFTHKHCMKTFCVLCNSSTATSSTTTSKKMFSSINNPDFSHDSGLGDDSDTSHRTSPALKFNSLSSSGMLHAKGPPTHLLFLHPEIGIHIFLNKCIILTCRN